ncbi:MAG: SPOR domain-containing protein [Proteobacteria bacterium]|nr:SPOR domain-containing protein [Pseudomonadota bacterium]
MSPCRFPSSRFPCRFARFLATLIALALVSGCSLSIFSRDRDREPECRSEACGSGQSSSRAQQKYYCYGDQARNWQCSQKPDTSRITTVIPDEAVPPTTQALATREATLSLPSPSSRPAQADVTNDADQAGSAGEAPGLLASPIAGPISDQDRATALLAFPESSYTIQLIAMRSLDPVQEYAASLGIDRPLYVRIRSNGELWYVLLLGVYPDHASAEEARQNWVGTRILKVSPWVRKVGPLQEEVRLSRRED